MAASAREQQHDWGTAPVARLRTGLADIRDSNVDDDPRELAPEVVVVLDGGDPIAHLKVGALSHACFARVVLGVGRPLLPRGAPRHTFTTTLALKS